MHQKPDLVIVNAEVVTMDTSQPSAEAVAVSQERILAVGDNKDIQALAGPNTQEIDGHGLTLLPGFMDSHIHLLSLARTTQELDFPPAEAPSVAAISPTTLSTTAPSGSDSSTNSARRTTAATESQTSAPSGARAIVPAAS